jgi:hypothetical protein
MSARQRATTAQNNTAQETTSITLCLPSRLMKLMKTTTLLLMLLSATAETPKRSGQNTQE